jgi:formate--tetrahydrofolate ligase
MTRPASGAEFVVMICGDVMKMTGLPAIPGAYGIGVDAKVNIFGMF